MPTVDTYGNINSRTQNKDDLIDFYHKAKPELNVEFKPNSASKFRILSNNDESEGNEVNEIFKNTVGAGDTPSQTPSSTTSVNTTILGPNGGIQKDES
jgi:hypothetical protein